jgi:restriction system protein
VAVPDFQTLMLPTLRLLARGRMRTSSLITQLSDELGLSEADRNELTPGGRQRRLNNRCHWAVTYLNHAGLITRVSRGEYEASDSGRALLKEAPKRITLPMLLERYPSVRGLRGGDGASSEQSTAQRGAPTAAVREESVGLTQTPDERLEAADRELKATLAEQLLERVRAFDPSRFEQLIIDLLVKMGYGGSSNEAAERLGRTGDGGIDGVIREDALGLDSIYLQAKRYQEDSPISPATIQAFAGALLGRGATKGVFVTTSRFTASTKAVVEGLRGNQRIVLIDGDELARLMIEHEVGVRTVRTVRIQRLDLEPYEDDEPV